MKIFIDSADVAQIKAADRTCLIDGVLLTLTHC